MRTRGSGASTTGPIAPRSAPATATHRSNNKHQWARDPPEVKPSLAHAAPSPNQPTNRPTDRRASMSLVHLANVCSHLQNASMARLGFTSVPSTNQLLSVALALQTAGFLSSVTRGGLEPPPFDDLSSYVPEPVVQENISTRRLWLGLKYWRNKPVLSNMHMISRPTKRIWCGVEGLSLIARGNRHGHVAGMSKIGECIFVTTDKGVMEIRECVEKRIGGMLLCRVS
ncbi:hypothetical protein K3495_g3535 [Podosphaera aphanis]|nr:hypothetical protein K3495_g3535 [Podosphaera aphanis]